MAVSGRGRSHDFIPITERERSFASHDWTVRSRSLDKQEETFYRTRFTEGVEADVAKTAYNCESLHC